MTSPTWEGLRFEHIDGPTWLAEPRRHRAATVVAGAAYLAALCLAVLGFMVFAAILLAAPDWLRDGYVEAPPAGEALHLTGVPGDEINLKLPVPKGGGLDKRELSVSLHDAESDFEAVLPLRVRADEDEDGKPLAFYGRFRVPAVPGQPRARLAGTLQGSYWLSGGGQEAFRVPLTLQSVTNGEATTSGFKDIRWQRAAFWAWVGLFVAVTAGPPLLVLFLVLMALVLAVLRALAHPVSRTVASSHRSREWENSGATERSKPFGRR